MYKITNGARGVVSATSVFNAALESIAVDAIAVLAAGGGGCAVPTGFLKTSFGTKNPGGRGAIKPLGALDEESNDVVVLHPSNRATTAPVHPSATVLRRISHPSQEMMVIFNISDLQRTATIGSRKT
ncbi:MAG: hypothetical protein KA803_00965 [Rhodoferax sp.]|nr:hypothetical protein [Rhodoferax sp.]